MDNNIICHECGTENEPQYIYCKNCGARLAAEAKVDAETKQPNSNFTHSTDAETNAQTFNDNFAGRRPQSTAVPPVYSNFIIDTIEGVSTDDVVAFVGTKSSKFVPKFSKMELSRSKISWCWPPAILGFLFGPMGAAMWFFYRKMYKIALILVAIGILCGSVIGVLNGYVAANTGDFTTSIIEELPSEFQSVYSPYFDILKDIKVPNYTPVYEIAGEVLSIASLLFGGLFSMHLYKKHIALKINEYKLSNIDPRYYKLGLASVGGTSSGMAWLGFFIYVFADSMFDMISIFISNFVG